MTNYNLEWSQDEKDGPHEPVQLRKVLWRNEKEHLVSTCYMPGALHILPHLIIIVTIWGLNHVYFIGEEIELRSVQREFIATLLQSFCIFGQECNAKLGTDFSVLVVEVGNRIGEQNFNLMLNHTNRTKLTFCGNEKLLPKSVGPKKVFKR